VFISTEWAPQQFTLHQTGATPARDLAERLSARAIREAKNLEAVVLEVLEDGASPEQNTSEERRR
jgi:hypothetical protein